MMDRNIFIRRKKGEQIFVLTLDLLLDSLVIGLSRVREDGVALEASRTTAEELGPISG